MSTQRKLDARLDFRLPADAKELIEQAAALSGQNVSDFAVGTLLHQAGEVIERHRLIRITRDDFDLSS